VPSVTVSSPHPNRSRSQPEDAHRQSHRRVPPLRADAAEEAHASYLPLHPHKFRHTFATNHLRDGVDIRTVQSWLGHRDIKSTMVYLKGIRSKDAAQKVNSGELAALVA